MMKIAMLYGPFSIGQRPIDFDHVEDSPRGLTGSELSCLMYAVELAERGHTVDLLVHGVQKQYKMNQVTVLPLPNRDGLFKYALQSGGTFLAQKYDVVYSWNEPDLLRWADSRSLRMCNQQLNDFSYCRPGFDAFVDVWTSPSRVHRDYLLKEYGHVTDRRKWKILPNGCNAADYAHGPNRIDGYVLWASSADRGLHLLLEMWPRIRRAVPWAELHCFYNMAYGTIEHITAENSPKVSLDIVEIANRVRYIKYALEALKDHGVTHHGSVSRKRMAEEFQKADVFAYPCDTIRFTEGFSVSTLEACAAGCIPVIFETDALGDIYGDVAVCIPPGEKTEFCDAVNHALIQGDEVGIRAECRKWGEAHDWSKLVLTLEEILKMGKSDNIVFSSQEGMV